MKRIWIAIMFLVISAGLCAGEQLYIEKVYNDINELIAKTEEYNDLGDVFEAIENIDDYWDAHNDLLFAIADSQSVNELGQAIVQLNPQDDDFEKNLSELKVVNNFFYRNQKVTLANVF